MKKKLCLILAMMLVVTAFAVGCSTDGTKDVGDENIIKIGVFEPMTGPNAAGGALEIEALELANELYPEVLGKKVELVVVDNKSDKVESANAVRRLIDKDKVSLVIGSWGSSFSMAAGPILQEAQVPAIGTSATNPLVTKGNPYYFRVCFIDTFQSVVMANYAYGEVGARKIAVIQEISSDYSVALSKLFAVEFKKLTGDEDAIVSVSNYSTGDQDFTAQLTNIKASGAEAIFAPGNFTESALIMKQAKELGIDLPLLGADTWETPEVIEIAGEAAEGAVFSTFFDSEVPMTETTTEFLNAYKAKYGEDKEPAAVTALAFDAYLLALDAIERADSTDSIAIRDAIAETKSFPGAAGFLTLNEDGDAIKSAVIKVISNGKFTYKTTIQPEQE